MKPTRPLTPYLFAAPAMLVFGLAVLWPVVLTLWYSLTEWTGFGTPTFIGLANYAEALRDEIFRASFAHVGVYIAVTLVLQVLAGLGLAGVLTARPKGTGFFRVAFFTPVMLPMVVVAVLWAFVYNPDFGLVNGALGALGLESWQKVWLGDENTALLAISLVSGWVYVGFYMAIFYAAFRQLPKEVLEAATLDGASAWTTFLRVKVPMVRSIVEVGVLLCVTGGFQAFDLFYVLTNGGPYNSTEIPTTYITRVVFRDQEVGYGSAMAVLMTVVVLLIGLVYRQVRARAELAGLDAGRSRRPGRRGALR